jgi:RNA polymerase sigma-70 factor (ECF subfamily)
MPALPDREFEDIYREYRSRIYHYLARMVGQDEAEDLTQEVFVKAGKSLHSFDGLSQISTWLFRIATNTALDRLRSNAYRKETVDSVGLESISDTGHDRDVWVKGRGKAPDDLLIRKEMSDCVRSIIDSLPESDRMVIVLSETEGFSDHEIAAILDLKVGTIRVRLHRARARLKEKLEAACDFYRTQDNILACDKKPPVLSFRGSSHAKRKK